MSDHYHYEYASDRHDHRGDYADQRHDHDGDYAALHHRHYDDESAVRGLRQDLGAAEERIRALEDDLRGALECIRVLDRLRPTCVICLDATADRQTVRGPACTDCVGDPPADGPDPDRPETWVFGEAPVQPLRPDEAGGYVCPETRDGQHCGDWHEGGKCGACGQTGLDPDEGGASEHCYYVMPEDYERGQS